MATKKPIAGPRRPTRRGTVTKKAKTPLKKLKVGPPNPPIRLAPKRRGRKLTPALQKEILKDAPKAVKDRIKTEKNIKKILRFLGKFGIKEPKKKTIGHAPRTQEGIDSIIRLRRLRERERKKRLKRTA